MSRLTCVGSYQVLVSHSILAGNLFVFIALMLIISIFSVLKSQKMYSIFQFDSSGNMYVYQPGAGFSGICKKFNLMMISMPRGVTKF